jgi:hypothetical protein
MILLIRWLIRRHRAHKDLEPSRNGRKGKN